MEYPNDTVTKGSKELLEQGVRVLQGNRLDTTEKNHVLKLAGYMNLNGEKEVADMGCGFGEVSRILSELLPAAHFWLININEFQLAQCPTGDRFTVLRGDMAQTSIPDYSVDLVMFNYSLCHADRPLATIVEANRIADPSNGRLFVYDYERIGGNNELTEKVLAARFYTKAEFKLMCGLAKWRYVEKHEVAGDDSSFRKAMANDPLYDEMFQHLRPVIWTARV